MTARPSSAPAAATTSPAATPGAASRPGAAGPAEAHPDAAAGPMIPRPFRVTGNRPDTPDTVTLTLEPVNGVPLPFAAGQFTMIGPFGAAEVPISISGDPAGGPLIQTIRDVGGVTHGLARAEPGDVLAVRGPYGTGWDQADAAGGDLVIVAGGIGLAPLRSVVLDALAHRDRYGRVTLLYGARSPGERLYPDELADWAYRGIEVAVTVDQGMPGWAGRVGLVTRLVKDARLNGARTLALVCGPEVMMRFVAAALTDEGLPADRIRLSMERNMVCGIGLCGHCQLREFFICTDGPVFSYAQLGGLLTAREV
jgi:NAD(P)H-flavin reductase